MGILEEWTAECESGDEREPCCCKDARAVAAKRARVESEGRVQGVQGGTRREGKALNIRNEAEKAENS